MTMPRIGIRAPEPPASPAPPEPPASPEPPPQPAAPRLRTEADFPPETWGEYADWKATKRMSMRFRQVSMAMNAIDMDLRDSLDEAIHESLISAGKLADAILTTDVRALLADKQSVSRLLGDVLFATTTAYDHLAENWGVGKLINSHFAKTEDLAAVGEFYQKVSGTVGAPTEIVGHWRRQALATVTTILIGVSELSAAFRVFRWDALPIDIEVVAARFAEVLACVEVLAAFHGLTLVQCLLVNQHKLNDIYPKGWKPAEPAAN